MAINILTPAQLGRAYRQVNRPAGRRGRPLQLKAIAENAKYPPRVRVEATTEAYREAIKHPNGRGFRKEGSVEWPLDRFTLKRIREGVVKIVAHVDAEQKRTPVVEPHKEEKPHERHASHRARSE